MSEHPTQAPRSSETVKKEKSNLDYTCLVLGEIDVGDSDDGLRLLGEQEVGERLVGEHDDGERVVGPHVVGFLVEGEQVEGLIDVGCILVVGVRVGIALDGEQLEGDWEEGPQVVGDVDGKADDGLRKVSMSSGTVRSDHTLSERKLMASTNLGTSMLDHRLSVSMYWESKMKERDWSARKWLVSKKGGRLMGYKCLDCMNSGTLTSESNSLGHKCWESMMMGSATSDRKL
eukprot:1387314-Amorphochlora_amoeboformis.AAC.1